ncbi:MAG: hypothetical protein F8N37_21065 [Telmatospirillum sp.]|nr:hypothetical protein [Telmatospirillum sp.]
MSDGDALRVVRFEAAGARFAIEARHVLAMRPAVPDRELSVESWLGLAGGGAAGRCLLDVSMGGGQRLLEFAGDVRVDSLPAASIHPLPVLLAARTRLPGLAALALDADGVVLIIDPTRIDPL